MPLSVPDNTFAETVPLVASVSVWEIIMEFCDVAFIFPTAFSKSPLTISKPSGRSCVIVSAVTVNSL